MFRVAVLCLAVVGVVSAWDWRGIRRNRQTECGNFKPIERGWFSKTRTDVGTRQILADIDTLDTNKDGFLTYAESVNDTAQRFIDPRLDLNSGLSRCDSVNFDMKRYGFSREVANAMFNLVDSNKDQVFSLQDQPPEAFNLNDRNGDGKVSRCELFQSYMGAIQQAENFIHKRKLQYENLVWESREPRWRWFSWW